MKVAVLQSNYIPWKGYFDIINDADVFVFYDEVQYTKNDWRNRNRIFNNQLQWISIPIDKFAVKQKISEVKINDDGWQNLHFKTLFLSYKRAPHFGQLEEFMTDVYKEHQWENLSELNHYSIKKISDLIGIKTKFLNSKDFDLKEGRIEKLTGLLEDVGAKQYITGPSALDYLSNHENLFNSKKIEIIYKGYDGYPAYPQRSPQFENHISILDLLANVHCDKIADYIWNWRTDI